MGNSIVWKAVLACALLTGVANAAGTASVLVTIPAVFTYEDGTQLIPKVDYKHTRTDYGPCSGDDELLTDILGGSVVLAGQISTLINYVPIGVKL